jgi:hypothetical protein
VAVAVFHWISRTKAREKHAEEMWDLRFPTMLEESIPGDTFRARGFVDFKEMLFVGETSDYDYHHTRVFHIRRLDGPEWEMLEEEESRLRALARMEEREPKSLWKERLEELKDRRWKPMSYPTLEVAYQRFLLHYRDDVVWAASPVSIAVSRDLNHWSNKKAEKFPTPNVSG